MGVGGQPHSPSLYPGKGTRYPSYRRLDGPQGRSGQRKISPPTEIRSLDNPVACVILTKQYRAHLLVVESPINWNVARLQKIEPCATRSCWQTWQSPSETSKSRQKFPNYRLAVIYTTIVRPKTKLGRKDVSIPHTFSSWILYWKVLSNSKGQVLMQKEIKIHATCCCRQPQGTISQFTKAPLVNNLK